VQTHFPGESEIRVSHRIEKEDAARMLARAWDHLYDICPGLGHDTKLRTNADFEEWRANSQARHEIHMILRRYFTPKEREVQP